MSIALDLALFLRENNLLNSKGEIFTISSALRGYLFTLMFRVGSNPYAWVPQEDLALEMDMTIDGLKKISAKVIETGLIEVMQNPSDKRKNCYRPAEFLINYHQIRRDKSLTNTFVGVKYVPKRAPNSEEYVPKRAPKFRDRCTNVPIINCTNDLQTANNKGSKSTVHSLKQHIKINKIKEKEKEKELSQFSISNKKREKNKQRSYCPGTHELITSEEAKNIASKKNLDFTEVGFKFMNYHKSEGTLSYDWRALFITWLLNERPISNNNSDSFKSHMVGYSKPNNEIRCTVPDYGPGHPHWEELHGPNSPYKRISK